MVVETYALSEAMTQALVGYLLTDKKFWRLIGDEVDTECLRNEAAKELIEAAKAVKARTSKPPSFAAVEQELIRLNDSGKLTQSRVYALTEYVLEFEDASGEAPPKEELLDALVPMIKRIRTNEALKTGFTLHQKGEAITSLTEAISGIESIGRVTRADVEDMSSAGVSIQSIRNLDRLKTGIPDLDGQISGGLPRGQLGFFLGGAGDGKSTALVQVFSQAVYDGLFCLAVSLELPKPFWMAKVMANLTGIPTNDITNFDEELQRAEARMRELSEDGRLGNACIGEMTAKATKVSDIIRTIDEVQEAKGRKLDLLVVDYADKLGHDNDGEYRGMDRVYEDLRIAAVERRMWVWTASQSQRRQKGKKQILGIDDAADSQGKARVTDMMITLNTSDDNKEITFSVAKNRTGEGKQIIGPLPTQFGCSRIAPPNRMSAHDWGYSDDPDNFGDEDYAY